MEEVTAIPFDELPTFLQGTLVELFEHEGVLEGLVCHASDNFYMINSKNAKLTAVDVKILAMDDLFDMLAVNPLGKGLQFVFKKESA